MDGMGEIDSPETQQKTLSQLNAASDKCNAGCADKVSMVLEGVSVEDDNAAAQVRFILVGALCMPDALLDRCNFRNYNFKFWKLSRPP